jgi:pantothenate kinase type III
LYQEQSKGFAMSSLRELYGKDKNEKTDYRNKRKDKQRVGIDRKLVSVTKRRMYSLEFLANCGK